MIFICLRQQRGNSIIHLRITISARAGVQSAHAILAPESRTLKVQELSPAASESGLFSNILIAEYRVSSRPLGHKSINKLEFKDPCLLRFLRERIVPSGEIFHFSRVGNI